MNLDRVRAADDIVAAWAEHGLDDLVEVIALRLRRDGLANGDLKSLRHADATVRDILQRWIVLPRPATVGDLLDAPPVIREALEAQP